MKKSLSFVLIIITACCLKGQSKNIDGQERIADLRHNSGNISLNESFFNFLPKEKKKYNFSIEYICIDRIENTIIRRKLEFPIPGYTKVRIESGFQNLPTELYYYSFEIPLEAFNPDSMKTFKNSPFKNKKHYIQICLIPHIGGSFSLAMRQNIDGFDAVFGQSHSSFDFSKEKKYKWLLSGDFRNKTPDKVVVPFMKKAIWKYVDEYVIVSLEE